MRIVFMDVEGTITDNDVLVYYYCAAKGGKTEGAYHVREGDDLLRVAEQVAAGINTHWCKPLFEATAEGTRVKVFIKDGADDVKIGWYVEHIPGNRTTERLPGGDVSLTIMEG